jgi:hypothetical protein
MKPMGRPSVIELSQEIHSNPIILENHSTGVSGSTYGTDSEGSLEVDALKCIINREAYISRLQKETRTIKKKLKAEIPDIIDLTRAASVDVVHAIVKWREAKVLPPSK